MAENDDWMTRFEERLDAVGADVGVLKGDVQVLKGDVQRLRVLYEQHDTKIDTIAEMQAHHGRQLEEHGTLLREIKHELAPLGDIHDFVRPVADEHERRLSALETHTGIGPSVPGPPDIV